MSDLKLEELSREIDKLKEENIEQNIKISNLEDKILRMEYRISESLFPVVDPVIKNQRVIPKPYQMQKRESDLPPVIEQTKSFMLRDLSKWEDILGGTILNRLGIIALLLALIYFFKYAFDNNWVGDTGKVALGILFGLALLGVGEHFRKKGLHKFAYGFTGGGIASLYASIYAGYNFYQLLSIYPAFGTMILITLSAIGLSLHHDSPAIATFGVLGGFLTPFLLATPNPNALGLFGYLTFINIIVLGISLYRRWRPVNILGFVLTALVTIAWLDGGYQEKDLYITTAFTVVSFGIYLAVTIFYTLLSQGLDKKYDASLLIANPLVHFSALYYLFEESLKNNTGFLAVFMCIIYLLVGWSALHKKKDEPILSQLFFGVSTFFLTLAIPLQFSGFSVTVFWILEALFIWYAGMVIKDLKIRGLAAVVMLLGLFHLGAFDTDLPLWDLKAYWPFINNRTLVYVIFAGALLAGYRIYQNKSTGFDYTNIGLSTEKKLVYYLPVVAIFLLLGLITLEVDSLCRFNAMQLGSGDDYLLWSNIRMIGISVLWTLYSLSFIFFGLQKEEKFWRVTGFALLGIVILKLFFIDLAQLELLYRVIIFACLGGIMLLASYLYQGQQRGED